MNEKKMLIKWFVVILLPICIIISVVSFYMEEHTKQVEIPFPYINAENIEPDKVTEDIAKALGYPEVVPIVTKEDRFWGVFYNDLLQPGNQMKMHSLYSSFTMLVPEKNKVRILSYELKVSSGELVITYRKEIKYGRRPNEKTYPNYGYTLSNLLSAMRDFPIDTYHELAEVGHENADLYEIRMNSEAPLEGESFSYNRKGYIENNEGGIPFIISHLQWGGVKEDALNHNDPKRYSSFGGEGRTNLFYFPESYR